MRIKLSSDVIKDLRKIGQKNKQLIKKVEIQLELFKKNSKHPSLRVHKLTGRFKNRWSISITRSIRMVFILLDKDVAYFTAVGSHDQVYKK